MWEIQFVVKMTDIVPVIFGPLHDHSLLILTYLNNKSLAQQLFLYICYTLKKLLSQSRLMYILSTHLGINIEKTAGHFASYDRSTDF